MSTPRTDAKATQILQEFGPNNNQRFAAMADFARGLEGETVALQSERDEALKALEIHEGKKAPVQGYVPGIPWDMHMEAYAAYCKKYGEQKALIEGWCRGGFGDSELDMFIPGWRDELKRRQDQSRETLAKFAESKLLKTKPRTE